MRTFKNAFLVLLAGATFLFSACEGTEDEPFIEPEVPGEYDLHTLNPDINEDRVVFRASLNTNDAGITYGFMWYEKTSGNEQPVVTTVQVGSGAHSGTFSIPMTDLPKNTALVVCSYVEFEFAGGPQQQIAEELDFGWD